MTAEPTVAALDLEAPGLQRLLSGVRIVDGALELAPVPADPEPLEGAELDALGGAAGIGVDANGNVYVADPAGNRILRYAACVGAAERWGCAAAGTDPGSLLRPRGLAVGPRRALYVADSGNHRVQAFDLDTGSVRAVIGQSDPYAPPQPGAADGELNEPWDVAFDVVGNLYVADLGNARVQRFDPDGHVDPAFAAESSLDTTRPRNPEFVAVVVVDGLEYVLVFDRTGARRSRLLVYDLDGRYRQTVTQLLRRSLQHASPDVFAQAPSALAAGEGVFYVADASGGRILSFDADGAFLGAVRGYHGPVAGLALDDRGRLLVHPGGGQPLSLAGQSIAASGTFRIGPFRAPIAGEPEILWQRLEARLGRVPAGAHVRLFTLTTETPAIPGPSLPESPDAGAAEEGSWHAAPPDALDFLLANEPATFLWIGGRLEAGEGGSPRLGGFQASFDGEGWLRYLPAIYSRDEQTRAFLEPALAALEAALVDEERLIDDLPLLFDAAAAPDDGWLDWLSGWLAFPLEPTLPEERRRSLVAAAFELAGRRGTPAGLRELIRVLLDVDVAVVEPLALERPWSLGGDAALLGFSTSLVAAAPDGAVLGTTAELGGSHLLDARERGVSLAGELAHRFCVRAYASDLTRPGARSALERIVERERPAHTEAQVCVVDARMRVGVQATVGVDAIVGAGRDDLRLGESGLLDAGAALAGMKHQTTGPVVGATARAGREHWVT